VPAGLKGQHCFYNVQVGEVQLVVLWLFYILLACQNALCMGSRGENEGARGGGVSVCAWDGCILLIHEARTHP